MQGIQTFHADQFGDIRTLIIDGEPWFVAKDIAVALGYTDAEAMTRRLDDDEKANRQIVGLGSKAGGRGTLLVNEPRLYACIFRSNKPDAKQFKRWVTHEVLPSIRKKGCNALPGSTLDITQRLAGETAKLHYMKAAADTMIPALQSFGVALDMARVLVAHKVRDETGIDIIEHLPSAGRKGKPLNPTQIGELMGGLSARLVNLSLASLGLQEKVNSQWVLAEKGAEYGEMVPYKSQHSQHAGFHILWNQKVVAILQDALADETVE